MAGSLFADQQMDHCLSEKPDAVKADIGAMRASRQEGSPGHVLGTALGRHGHPAGPQGQGPGDMTTPRSTIAARRLDRP
jgi:hypothetical protein